VTDRQYPTRPFVGVGAIVVADGKVVVVKRRHEPLAGRWSLPGGLLELGESLAAGVAREVKEETGLDVDVGPIVEVVDRIYHDASGRVQYHYVLADYLCRPSGGRLAAGDDAGEVALVGPDELASYGVASGTIDVIRKGLAKLGG
jgi:8-oxo-dGTP diphosphatase